MNGYQLGYNSEYSEDAPSIDDIEAISGFAIVEFGASWCPHCQAGEVVVAQCLKAYPTLPHIKVLDGKGKKLGRQFSVKLWPTIVLLKEGTEVARVVRPTANSDLEPLIELLK
ncbi:thiol reductase thioredoxin [Vibrio sp. UCD-FRSSP16_10]|uniref:thioredoxin family protein n=1 Tax=unclassified Vibrio TaxID=2614977 RepID=UPI0007FBE9B6|nr:MULTISPECIES: thioredoxin family protein [unclassified Vibrio]OBT12055.1 thiol reductase thioredoxin [Vibrio sp. UCD-FRSSP16_30]OBT20386.1 thiol reductase thioredoxin [Vibrio sp. UCD-FRSSP16_10]